jgi:hypothetical protein
VLLLSGERGLRTCYARHTTDELTRALPWLLDRMCQMAAPDLSAGTAPRPGRRWPLVAGDADGAPPGVAELAAGTSWCFPLGEPGAAVGLLVIGDGGQDRLPLDVAALAADLACRIGLALHRDGLRSAGQADAGQAATGQAGSGQAATGQAGSGQAGSGGRGAGTSGTGNLAPDTLVGYKS